MSRNSNESDRKAMLLRHTAENRIRKGSTPRAGGLPLDKDALALLYEMASNPKRSSDALRLLQELQVHQVELDLQREELENSEHEMSRELARYKAVFELTPTACLVTTSEGRIIEGNPAAASVLKTRHEELVGRALQDMVMPESKAVWSDMLRQLKAREQAVGFEMVVGTRDNEAARLKFSGSCMPTGDVLLFGVLSRESELHDVSPQQRSP